MPHTVPLLSNPDLFDEIASMNAMHARDTNWWHEMNERIDSSREELRDCLMRQKSFSFGPLGPIQIEYIEMGAVSTLDLFGLDEMIIFAFYWKSRDRYKRVVDMGANIGLHSVVLGLMGYEVTSYEPDPQTFAHLQRHIAANSLTTRVETLNKAVDTRAGSAKFVRVLGNTTGSHLQGAKADTYGDLEVISVPTVAFTDVVSEADLIKMDVEGMEAQLLKTLRSRRPNHVDVICEVGNNVNASEIWTFLRGQALRPYSQKCNWLKSQAPEDLPQSYKDGSLFLTTKSRMTWL